MLQCALYLGGDPDHHAMDRFGRGVRLGVGVKLPRTPAVCSRKQRWRLVGLAAPPLTWLAGARPWAHSGGTSTSLPSSTRASSCCSSWTRPNRGLAPRPSANEAAYYYPDLTVNSLTGIAKMSDIGEVASVPLVMDGIHGVVATRASASPTRTGVLSPQICGACARQALSGPAVRLALVVREAHRSPKGVPRIGAFRGADRTSPATSPPSWSAASACRQRPTGGPG